MSLVRIMQGLGTELLWLLLLSISADQQRLQKERDHPLVAPDFLGLASSGTIPAEYPRKNTCACVSLRAI